MDRYPETLNQNNNPNLRAHDDPQRGANKLTNLRTNENCKLFIAGRCSYGQRCKYSHGNGDRNNVARYVDVGNARFSKLCLWFLSGEGCPYGQNCHFLHDGPDGNFRKDFAPDIIDLGFRGNGSGRPDKRKTRLCLKWEETGDCAYGTRCLFAHGREDLCGYEQVNKKTKLCHKWEKMGSCDHGTSCNYAHGEEELSWRFCSQPAKSNEEVMPNSSTIISCAAPRGSYSGTALGSAPMKDRKSLFKSKTFKQLNGIYGDWIE